MKIHVAAKSQKINFDWDLETLSKVACQVPSNTLRSEAGDTMWGGGNKYIQVVDAVTIVPHLN